MPSVRWSALGLGSSGVVFKISLPSDTVVAMKLIFDPSSKEARAEKQIFEETLQYCTNPNIVRYIFHTSERIFLRWETLQCKIAQTQQRDSTTMLVRANIIPQGKVLRWIWQLTDALSWLEGMGLIHGDFGPRNLQLHSGGSEVEDLKLIDFGSVSSYGFPHPGGHPPDFRLLDEYAEDGQEASAAGKYSVRSEQFAVGSIIYFASRGFELFEYTPFPDVEFAERGPHIVDLLQRKIFPPLRPENCLDNIIHDCCH